MLTPAGTLEEPSALIKWLWALIFIAGTLVCGGIVYAFAKLKERVSRSQKK